MFQSIIGQNRVKNALTFYLQSYEQTKVLSPIGIFGARGLGKTSLCREVAKRLNKTFIEINGASVKKIESFITNVIVPHVVDKPCLLFLDECHAIDKGVANWLLSILAPTNNKAVARYSDYEFEFDYRQFSFLVASTNPEKLSKPFIDRLKKLELEPYTMAEQIQILHQKSGRIKYYHCEKEIVLTCRQSPRTITSIVKDILDYCKIKDLDTFTFENWLELKKILGLRPLGISNNEFEHLKILQEHGPQSLTSVSAKLGLDTQTVRADIELYLLKNNLIGIDGKRHITVMGQKCLAESRNS
jgi:Holliday junction resolvasome RuvABC ATP-dependent DNA helicase subunit